MESQTTLATPTATFVNRRNRKKALGMMFGQFLTEHIRAPLLPPTNVRSSFEDTRVFVFDFDLTLTPIHLFRHLQVNKSISVEELAEAPYADPLFNESVGELFRYLREKGKTIYIASRNYEDIIIHYIRQNIDPEFPLENIYADRGNFFTQDQTQFHFSGKGKAKVFADNAHRLHELLYIDDTFSDIEEFAREFPELQHHHKNYFEPLSIDKIHKIFNGTISEEPRGFTSLGLSPPQAEKH